MKHVSHFTIPVDVASRTWFLQVWRCTSASYTEAWWDDTFAYALATWWKSENEETKTTRNNQDTFETPWFLGYFLASMLIFGGCRWEIRNFFFYFQADCGGKMKPFWRISFQLRKIPQLLPKVFAVAMKSLPRWRGFQYKIKTNKFGVATGNMWEDRQDHNR